MSKYDFMKTEGKAKLKDPTGAPTPEKQRGRPPAKRTDPEYVQITAYIRRATHQQAKLKLLEEQLQKQGDGRDFSELIEDLLSAWLQKSTQKRG